MYLLFVPAVFTVCTYEYTDTCTNREYCSLMRDANACVAGRGDLRARQEVARGGRAAAGAERAAARARGGGGALGGVRGASGRTGRGARAPRRAARLQLEARRLGIK